MKFRFEKFIETDMSFAARVTVRQRTGQLGFNLGAINRFNVRDYNFCILYFDGCNRAIGLELVKERCEGAIEIKQSRANTYLRAKNFLDKYGIDYKTSHTHELKRDEASGLLYIELTDVVEDDDESTAGETGPQEEEEADAPPE